ncbi:MAG: hypothetical protein DME25_08005 [Verrucomicrobia bacterium]|nr:MAG: hypothetical protein DME25_08005 [Verrucomicrobiota bacterium]
MTKLQVSRLGKGPKKIVVVAAYEDAPTDARVCEFCRSLVQHFGPKCEVTKQMWLLNELRVPQLCSIAAGEAAQADLVVVSQAWGGQKACRACVLLALFDPIYQGDSGSIRAYLEQVARQKNIEFLVQAEEAPDDR